MKLDQQLQELGLTEGEAKVYLALLKHGSSTVGPIVKESRVAYSNIYEILERLQEKGLTTFIIKSKTKHFTAVPPTRIKEFLQKKAEQLVQQRDVLSSIIPELDLLQKLAGKTPEAEVFVGWKAMVTAQLRLIEDAKPGDELPYFYVYNEEYTPRVDALFQTFDYHYKEKQLVVKGIAEHRYKSSEYIQSATHMEMRYVDFPVPNNIDICNDKIIITAWSVPMAVLITSKEIADNFRRTFNEVWKQARP